MEYFDRKYELFCSLAINNNIGKKLINKGWKEYWIVSSINNGLLYIKWDILDGNIINVVEHSAAVQEEHGTGWGGTQRSRVGTWRNKFHHQSTSATS